MSNLQNVIKVEIESEGEINGYFTIYYKDGTTRKGWSCDQGSIEMDDNQYLDEDTHNFCMNLWFDMDIDNEWYEGRYYATWTTLGGLSETQMKEV